MSDYLVDPSAEPDPEVARLEGILSAAAYTDDLDWERVEQVAREERRRRSRRRLGAGAALVVAAAAVALIIVSRRSTVVSPPDRVAISPPCAASHTDEPWRVEVLSGAPSCGGTSVTGAVRLATGAWLETDAASRARVAVARVGELSLEPGTRLRLVDDSAEQHRFELERGTIHASVDAPPRLFVVSTPTAEAVDLGCEYDLTVADDGTVDLVVTGGSVSLEGDSRAVLVPTGYRARTLASKGPTPAVPVSAEASAIDAATRYTRDGDASALTTLLELEMAEATATLVGLLPLSNRADCEQIHERLKALSPMPFPWQQTNYGCGDIPTLFEAWHNLLEQTW